VDEYSNSLHINMDTLRLAIDKKNSAAGTNQVNAFLENVDILETDLTYFVIEFVFYAF